MSYRRRLMLLAALAVTLAVALASIVAVGVAFMVSEVLLLRGVSLDAPSTGPGATS